MSHKVDSLKRVRFKWFIIKEKINWPKVCEPQSSVRTENYIKTETQETFINFESLKLDKHQHEYQKLLMLEQYHQEYSDRLLGNSFSIYQLKHMQTFLDNLHLSVFEHTQVVKRLARELNDSRTKVNLLNQKKKGLEAMIEKREALEKKAALTREIEKIQETLLNMWVNRPR